MRASGHSLSVAALTVAAVAIIFAPLALAEVPNTSQDAMLGSEEAGPPDRFRSLWHVGCMNANADRRCEVTLQTDDHESKGYTRALRYPLRVVVDGVGRHIELLFAEAMPPDHRIDLILDGRVIASVRAGDRIANPALFEQLAHGRQLLISTGSFADGPRVRSYVMLDGLGIALADAQRRYDGW
jgi:hypothetical protein